MAELDDGVPTIVIHTSDAADDAGESGIAAKSKTAFVAPVVTEPAAPPSPALLRALEKMRSVFHIRDLRPGQAEIIESVLAGRDTLAVMPDRQRQVADLSAAGAGDGRADAGRLAAAGADRGSVQQAQSGGRGGGAHRVDAHREGARRRSGRRARGHDQAGDDHARIGELADGARGARRREVLPLLRRRGALRVAVGPRLPPGLPRAAPRRSGAGAAADPGTDRHRHPGHRRRRPGADGDEGREGLSRLLSIAPTWPSTCARWPAKRTSCASSAS